MNTISNSITTLRLSECPLNSVTAGFAEEIATLPGVQGIVLLPDSFTKEKYIKSAHKITVPSSAVISTDARMLYPQFRSRGTNCGMMVIALPFKRGELSNKFIQQLLKELTYPIFYYGMYRARLPFWGREKDLSLSELQLILEQGSRALLKIRNIDKDSMLAMEHINTPSLDLSVGRKLLNPKWFSHQAMRLRRSFGTYFGGNHFLEIQEVTDVQNNTLGLIEGQLVVMLHGGCDSVESLIREDLVNRYIKKNTFVSVTPEDEMWQAFFFAQSLIINFTSAYRLNSFAIVRDTVKRVLGAQHESRVLLEKGHNTVSEELGQLLYRHNAERITEGSFTILSGSRTHPSYIMEGLSLTGHYLNSIDHGLGAIIKSGLTDGEDKVVLHDFKHGLHILHKKKEIMTTFHRNSDQYHDLVAKVGLAKRVVTLLPVFNIKYLA